MAVLTETNRRDFVFGNCRVIVGTLTWANNDTWQPGLRQIVHVDMSQNATGQTSGYTASGGTVTLLSSSGSLSGTVMVFGFD